MRNSSNTLIRGLKIRHVTLLAVVLSLCVSCGPPNERAHPAFKKGVNLEKEGKFKEAAASFEKYLLVNPRSSITHSKLADIYNDNLNDPLMAIYHFRKFLEFEPESADAQTIEAWITAAEKRYASEIRSKYPDTFTAESELAVLKNREAKYRECILKLKDWNAKLLNKNKTTNSSTTTSATYSTYVVCSGDTLTMISRKIYGTSKYHKNIFDANRDILETESSLDIGQKLKIPDINGAPKHDNN